MRTDNFKNFLKEKKSEYKRLKPVYCPSLKNWVTFPMKGFNHLRFKIDNTPRNPREVIYKTRLLSFVKEVICEARGVEKYRIRKAPIGGSRKRILKKIEYWALVKNVREENLEIRVILRKSAPDGNLHFWSVMSLSKIKKPHHSPKDKDEDF